MRRVHKAPARKGAGGLAATALLLALVCLAGAVAFLMFGHEPTGAVNAGPDSRPAKRDVPQGLAATSLTRQFALPSGLNGTIGETRTAAYDEARTVRQVTGGGITRGPQADGPLERLPSTVEVPPPAPPPPPEPDRFRLVVVRHADLIDARTHNIDLAFVDAPAADVRCTDAAGNEWPCGMRARTEVRRLIQRRDIACAPVDEEVQQDETVSTSCSVGRTNIGRWLVEHGWAEPAENAPEEFQALHAKAREEKIGLWQASGR